MNDNRTGKKLKLVLVDEDYSILWAMDNLDIVGETFYSPATANMFLKEIHGTKLSISKSELLHRLNTAYLGNLNYKKTKKDNG